MFPRFPFLAIALILSPVVSQGGIFAHYSFDTDFTDSTGNGRNGTLTEGLGIPTTTSGGAPAGTSGNTFITTNSGDFKFGGGAMSFSTDRDYIALPQENFAATAAWSIAFWARVAAPASGEAASAANFDMVIGDISDTNNFIALSQGGVSRFRGSSSVAANQQDFATGGVGNDWHHFAIVADGAGGLKIYRDNIVITDVTGKNTAFLYDAIGEAYSANTTSNDFDFHGELDEVWVFDEAISATTVSSLYNTNTTTSALHLKFDGGFTDSSGRSNNGIPAGAAAITTTAGSFAHGSGGLSLDGADGSSVALTTPLSFSASLPWTVAWWAKRDLSATDKGMVLGNASNTTDFIWQNDSFTGLRFRSSSNVTHDFTVPKDALLHHYALAANGAGSLSLYEDGALVQTKSGDTSFSINTIGNAYPTSAHYNFKGSLDEIHVYENALDAAAVLALYNSEKPAPPTGNTSVTRLRIVLLGGQSNADGRATVSSLPTSPVNFQQPQADVDFFYKVEGKTAALTTLRPGLSETSQFGPEITLGWKMADFWAGETNTRVAIIKYANGGTNLAVQWKAGGNATTTGDGTEYLAFQQTVNAGLAALAAAYPAAVLDLQGMVWFQGESDAIAAYAPSYQSNLTAFISDVRATFGTNLPFIIARLSSGQTNLNATYLNQVRAAQDAVNSADRLTGLIETDTFPLNADFLHFSAAGQQLVGQAFASEAAYYEWMVDHFSAADIAAGLAEKTVDRDGDGQSNYREFLSITDPNSGSSSFSSEFTYQSLVNGEISYPSSVLRLYSIERYREADGVWEQVLSPLAGTGSTVTRSLSLAAPRGLFRVRADLP